MSFGQGLSGLNAAARQLDVIGNNVANASTVGFKSSQALFAALYANSVVGSTGMNVGLGTTVAAVQANFGQGNITATTNPLDIAINGPGFFRLDTNGVVTFSRTGQFHVDKDGFIVNVMGSKVTGYGVDASGAIVPTLTPLQISLAEMAPATTTLGGMVVNLDSREPIIALPFLATDPKTYNKSSSITVYDTLGNAHTESTYFVKTAANTWSVYGSMDGAVGVSLGTLKFKPDGSLDTAASPQPFNVTAPLTNGATTPFAFTLDFTGSTQYGSTFGTTSLTQNGFASGKLAGFSVSDDGSMVGRYTNGQTRTLGQVALASFASVDGLKPLGSGWAETSASGQPLIGVPGSGSVGALQAGAVEESNVDLTKELVDMIVAQRVYQANAQTIKTQDQVMQTIVNLR